MGLLPPEETNPFADDEAARILGQEVFCDEELGPHDISCAGCHQPESWFTSDIDRRPGSSEEFRSITSVVDVAYYEWHGWHGGKDSLWSLALGALEKPSLIDSERGDVANHVYAAHYREKFIALFGEVDLPVSDERVNDVFKNVGWSLEAYMRTIVSGSTPFDAYVRGGGEISESAKRGLELFIGKGNCIACHSGPRLTDDDFHNIGLSIAPETSDRASAVEELVAGGTFAKRAYPELAETDSALLVGAFRTPTLRNVAMTAPYMHTAEFTTFDEVLWHYNAAPEAVAGIRDEKIWPLDLSPQEVLDLTAFLHTLTSTERPVTTCPTPARRR
jgi:cytochrome c peroxidase